MRISDWSSDVCSSDLGALGGFVAREDFLRAVACTMPPMVTNLPDGVRLYTTPHPTQGRVLGEALTNLNRGMSETEAIVTARPAFGAGGGGGTSVVPAADGEGTSVVVANPNSFPP